MSSLHSRSLPNQTHPAFKFPPQVKQYFWDFIHAVDKYEGLKDTGNIVLLTPLMSTIQAGMTIWANQLSPELSRSYSLLYASYITSTSFAVNPNNGEEHIRKRWNYIHEVAKQIALDLKHNFAQLYMKDTNE